MSEDRIAQLHLTSLLILLILFIGKYVVGNSLDTDKQVLLNLRSLLVEQNRVNQGRYMQWNPLDLSPCTWHGISCRHNRVTGINLSNDNIGGDIFGNFSALTELTSLDLSKNSIGGHFPADLGMCQNLKFLNLSHNIIGGELNLIGLNSLEILDLSINRIYGDIGSSFPRFCNSLVVANISSNNFTGEFGNSFDGCLNLEYVDFSSNYLRSENFHFAFERLKEFAVSENKFSGKIPPGIFSENCSLEVLDLSENSFTGEFPKEISHCNNLVVLNLWGNRFTGRIPLEIGSIASLQTLLMGSNNFDREIPGSLIDLKNLVFLDMSRNNFGGDVQEIFGRIMQVKILLLHENSYTGGLYSCGILKLPNISQLDLSYNNFSGHLPFGFSQMLSLKYLFLASNQFTGNIPLEYGNFPQLQVLDLSYNRLNGSIPASFGKLNSLLWLMLANNDLTGEIPPDLGNCGSLLWLNFGNNHISGNIPHELTKIGRNATPTFLSNRENDPVAAGSGLCSAVRRWIPGDYAPFSFLHTILTTRKCRSLWDSLLKGHGIFPVCAPGSNIQTNQISGYVELSGNKLSGEIPREIGEMQNFSMLHLGANELSGTLPEEIGLMLLVGFDIKHNKFYGNIPEQLGNIKCLQNLDLSYNNFSGSFPISLNNLTNLSKFNISYNPYISGGIPATGQLATFEKWSFLGDPLLHLQAFIGGTADDSPSTNGESRNSAMKMGAFSFSFVLSFPIFFFPSFLLGLKMQIWKINRLTLFLCVFSCSI